MEYLLVMSLSGSMMIGIYLLLKWLLKDKVSARLYYLLIKESVLFFFDSVAIFKGVVQASDSNCHANGADE